MLGIYTQVFQKKLFFSLRLIRKKLFNENYLFEERYVIAYFLPIENFLQSSHIQ